MNCQQCSAELKQIPAGTSRKTGKPYQAFSVCPNGCKQAPNYAPAPIKNSYQPQATGQTFIDKDKMFFEALEKILEQQNLIAVQLERVEQQGDRNMVLLKSIESFVIGSETAEYDNGQGKKN